ncbi:SusC/RagA family TonB-linked outer membrane protein [Maribacter sp. 2304DJ31-5]|uniref:SusC/RagA family TonB-linked outer membrane protein n=1 Tax=Maribacter sp. 2304DJ31-5 TaxID=3386273 RepID=UPI0039BC7C69
MKIGLLLFLASLFTLQANETYGQGAEISLNLNKVSVGEFLDEVENRTEYRFIYKIKDVDLKRIVTINANKEQISTILNSIFGSSETAYNIVRKRIYLTRQFNKDVPERKANEQASNPGPTQELTITGTIKDNQGQPLPGASIIEKETKNGTQTDFDGNYSITVSGENAVLSISYIGFVTKEVMVNGQSTIDITLEEDTAKLDEVVVLGYGATSKRKVTSAISTIQGKELVKAPAANLAASLAGKLSGVITNQGTGQPGFDNVEFRIRGITSFRGGQTPLIIVDGIERPFTRINPNNIASISILKDASSTAVYGRRGANGVVLITTKRGLEGKPSFEYTGRFGLQSQTRKVELMNAAEYSRYLNEAKVNIGEEPLFTDEQVAGFENGTLPSYDWLDALLGGSAAQQQHNVSASGGNESTKYFASYGFLDQSGLYGASYFKQHSLRLNIDTDFTDNFRAGLDLLGRLEDRSTHAGAGSLYQGAALSNPTLNPFPDVPGVPDALGPNGFSGSPIGQGERSGTSERDNNVFQSNIKFEYDVPGIDGLLAKALYSYDYTTTKSNLFQIPYTYYAFDGTTEEYVEVLAGSNENILSSESRTESIRQTLQLSLDYKKEFGNHDIGALVLYEQIENDFNLLSASRRGYISTAIPSLFAGNVNNDSNNSFANESASRGWVGRINYGYKDKYLITAATRVDESFAFAEEFRTGIFPSISAAWVLSEEPFLVDSKAINFLKLRGSWGEVGNDAVNQFQYLSTFSFNGGTIVNGIFNDGISSNGIPNPSITWETVTSTNIGLDGNFLDNKFALEFDYFWRKTTDILDTPTGVVPATFGAGISPRPLGEFDSWGFETVLSHYNNIGDFNFSLEANVSWFNNKIVKFNEPGDINPALSRINRRFGERIGYIAEGLFQSQEEIDAHATQFGTLAPGDIKYRDINGRDEEGNLTGLPDGQINPDDRTVIGKPGFTNLTFGFNITADYKGIDFQANFQGASDFTRDIRPFPFERDGNSLKILVDSWRPGNEDAAYPRLTAGDLTPNNGQASDFWLTTVHYLRLRNLEIGYNFDYSLVDNLGIQSLRVYFSGNNLLTFSNLDWRDPEGFSSNLPFYPQVKVISLGLNVKF